MVWVDLSINRIQLVFAVIAMLPFTALAQDQSSNRFRLFAGYSYSRAEVDFLGNRVSSNDSGWGLSLSGRVTKHLGITADSAGHYGYSSFPGADYRIHELLFGPEITLERYRVVGFAHVLPGVVHVSSSDIPHAPVAGFPVAPLPGVSQTAFALGLGGGIDVAWFGHMAIRAAQIDYIPFRTRPRWTHDIRIQSGIVIRF